LRLRIVSKNSRKLGPLAAQYHLPRSRGMTQGTKRAVSSYGEAQLLRKGLRSNRLAFPAQNGAVEWPEIQLIKKTA
jgi:hypothetical protein